MSNTSPDLQSSQQDADDVTRAMPHAVGPEKSILSSMLQDPQDFIGLAIDAGLSAEHFYLPSHRFLYTELAKRYEAGKEVELVSLTQSLLDLGQLDKVGGPAAISELYTYSPSSGHFRHHLQMVKDKFVMRSLITCCNETISQAYDAPSEVDQLLDQTEASIMAIREQGVRFSARTMKQTVEMVVDSLKARLQGDEGETGLSTGFKGLDDLGVRLKPGEMVVIAARPSMGKSTMMMNIAETLSCDAQKNGLIFSLEMTDEALVERMILTRARMSKDRFSKNANPTKGELERFRKAAIDIAQAPISIDERAQLSIGQIRAAARRKHREKKLDYIAIDYLQYVRHHSKQAAQSREREVAEISAGIKALAKELHIPIIILAQLNRGPEGRTGSSVGVPRMSDLRESGAIEQDADIICLLYRQEYYATDAESKAACHGEAKVIVAKNRNGSTGTVPLTFIADQTRFEDGAPEREEPPTVKSRYDD
ncbi:MAG: replicative DNA helicase [Luteolibacter sp.]